ncbi:hypothetical protein [Sedimenticola hydrogenitrophicus]|uniref:hypothetical protein n=1 Tax=Sedimenticola hydrogenitrophicus TaxID=2967975 RepID=UPI0023B135F0|nr:hypothetical protein [Sedimenticola hydrogenitrophicus]
MIKVTDEDRKLMCTELGLSTEQQLIDQVRAAPDTPLPSCSTSEQITAALALDEPRLLPSDWQDSLAAYKRLDKRQRKIVDRARGWYRPRWP